MSNNTLTLICIISTIISIRLGCVAGFIFLFVSLTFAASIYILLETINKKKNIRDKSYYKSIK